MILQISGFSFYCTVEKIPTFLKIAFELAFTKPNIQVGKGKKIVKWLLQCKGRLRCR